MKMIRRTFKYHEFVITDAVTGDILQEGVTGKRITKEKIAMQYLKETGVTGFLVDIVGIEEVREMSYYSFIENSEIVEKENKLPANEPESVEV